MKRYIWLLLIAISFLPLASFFVPGLPVTHDGQDHVARIANFYQALSEGILVPRWAGNLNWGYGHPILMFLYPMSSYVASLFHSVGLSYVDATKAVFVFAYIASILSMYLWMSTAWGKRIGFVGALLYGFAPYRFVDMYIRGAIGEHMAFVFPPIICFFLYKLATYAFSKTYDLRPKIYYGVGLSISFAFLILSHNAISLMFLPLIGLYILYLFIFQAKKSLLFLAYCLMSIVLGFGLSSFFWLPAFIEGKYTLRNIVTAGVGPERFVPIKAFFYSPWNSAEGNTMTQSIGFFKTKEREIRFLLSVFYSLFFVSLFIMTPFSAWIWERIMILQNFQFPWRFLSLTTFLSAVLGGVSIPYIIKSVVRNSQLSKTQEPRTTNVLLVIFCFLIIVSASHMWRPKAYQTKDESFYTGIYKSTTDTGESSPIWTTRFMEQIPKEEIEVISGIARVEKIRRTTTLHAYRIVADTRAEFLENTIYFPGWEVLVDGNKTDIQFQSEIHRGIMSFWVDKGEHRVEVVFRDTKVRKIAAGITVVVV